MYTTTEIAPLSLIARLAIALHCFEQYCLARDLVTPEITVFLNYLWEFPIIANPEMFGIWEDSHPILVDVGLGNVLPNEINTLVEHAGIAPNVFCNIVKDVVEIIWGSFYATSDDAGSSRYLQHLLGVTEAEGVSAPSIENFSHSRFIDCFGWGNPLLPAERDQWRYISSALH